MREMRFVMLLAAVLLVACGSRSSAGPAWPKPSIDETDGGESLAPRQAEAVAVEKSKDAEPDVAADADPTETDDAEAADTGEPDADATDSPADASADDAADDEILETEELVIEIEDDE
jgi:hypothetical protein